MAKSFFPTDEFRRIMSSPAQAALRDVQSIQTIQADVTALQTLTASEETQIKLNTSAITTLGQEVQQLNTNIAALNPPWTDGQLLIGNSSENGPDKATLTAGALMLVTNGHGSIQLDTNASAASVLFGRGSAAGAGVGQQITLGTGLSMSGTVLSSTASGGALTLISTVVTSSQNSVTFSSISGSFTHLQLRTWGRSAAAAGNDAIYMQANGDTTGANYDSTFVGTSSGHAASVGYAANFPGTTVTGGFAGQSTVDINGYASTAFRKSWITVTGDPQAASGGSVQVYTIYVWWNSTAAITSLKVYTSSGSNFVDGTIISLYGYT